MPYRIDLANPPDHAVDILIDLGALDVELADGVLAAVMPDRVAATDVANALGLRRVRVSPAIGRDDESVWTLKPRPVRIRTLEIVPADIRAPAGALKLVDGVAFGTGLHATTALCLEALEDLLIASTPDRVLDVGTGSGVLALAAVHRGVRRAVGLDIDRGALAVAAQNARVNDATKRLSLVCGGPAAIRGAWPLVLANIRAAELMAMAPMLSRLVASRGRLVLSGIPESVGSDVDRCYRRLGMTRVSVSARDGWTALVFHPTW